jgi:ERCC4-related helicase
MPHETLIEIKPRKYQQEIFETCKTKNCLVVLPTGIGKTLIALMLAIYQQKQHPATKVLFLAPTRPLAQQHLDYFQKYLPELFADLQLFTGKILPEIRKKIWQTADIIFSTPQCISNDIKKGLYNLREVSLLIEDECHRCLKNYAYVYVVDKYKEQSPHQKILGLTASPGTSQQTIRQIAKNLSINSIELRTRDSEDVKEYLQELKFEKIILDFPKEFDDIRNLLKTIFNRKIFELKKRRLLFGPSSKTNLIETQSRIMRTIASGNKHFNLLSGASACAQTIKLQHALELLETQTLYSFHEYIQDLFEQARLEKSKAVQRLTKQPEFNAAYIQLCGLLTRKQEHPKLSKTKEIIEEHITKNPKFKAIVFSQYRSTVTQICKELNQIPNIESTVFIGQAKKTNRAGEEMGLSQHEQKQIIEDFKVGKINVLCATSIGEEGLDIPEVNTVIFYEPVPSAIRKIQRAGRTARLMKGQLIMLITKDTRDQAYYYAAFNKEKKMYQAIADMQQDIENKNKQNESNKTQKTLF